MNGQLTAIFCALGTAKAKAADKQIADTKRAQWKRIHALMERTWAAAWYFCNDRPGSYPNREAAQNYRQTVIYAEEQTKAGNPLTLEQAWCVLDPQPN